MMHNNIRRFESGDHSFDVAPPKRHSSYEDRAKSDSVSKRGDARLFVTQRNWNSTHKQSYDKTSSVLYQQNNEYSIIPDITKPSEIADFRDGNSSSVNDSLKRVSTGIGGNRHLQPRQNPLMGHSPRSIHKIHLTPSEKKKKYGKESTQNTNKPVLIREVQNQSAGNNFMIEQKAKRNRSSELISGYYKINRSKLTKKQYGIS